MYSETLVYTPGKFGTAHLVQYTTFITLWVCEGETERETETQRDRKTERQRQRDRGRETKRQKFI